MMIKYNFIKALTAGVALTMAIYPQAFAADTGSCGTNCVYTYSNGTLTYSVADSNTNNGKGKITISNYRYGIDDTIENIIVNEGITGVRCDDNHSGIENVGTANGKLVLPDNFSTEEYGMWRLGFGIIEIGNNTTIVQQSMRFDAGATPTIVMSADSNIGFQSNAFQGFYPSAIKIACKGNPDDCLAKFGTSLNNMTGAINADYYQEKDSEGNLTLYNNTGYNKYDPQGNILANYDMNDNLLTQYDYTPDGSVYTYDANHKLIGAKKTSPFTPAEAAALVKKGNVNKVTLTFK